MHKNISLAIITIAAVALLILGVRQAEQKQEDNQTISNQTACTTVSTTTTSDTVTTTPTNLKPSATTVQPMINRSTQFSPALDAATRVGIQEKINRQQVFLGKTPSDPFLWINLGTLRVMAGDTAGAKEAWQYVKILAPKDAIPYFNLGAMYADNMKDYASAEMEYGKALELSPQAASGYIALAQIYIDAYKTNTDLAEKTLLKGIVAIQNPYELQVMLARYYKSKKRLADAKTMYEHAVVSATAAGKAAVATDIKQESTE